MKCTRLFIMVETFLLAAGLLAVSGCISEETRYRVLSTIFEGVAKPGQKVEHKPVIRQARRVLPSPAPTPQVTMWTLGAPEREHKSWLEEVLGKLPKDAAGNFDMVRSLNEKLIEPKPGIGPGAKDQPVLNLNVELIPKGQPRFKVSFAHKAHTQWLACVNCHPAIFKMKRGADEITMAKIFAGQYCGRCHGKVAFAVPTGCSRCHLDMKGGR